VIVSARSCARSSVATPPTPYESAPHLRLTRADDTSFDVRFGRMVIELGPGADDLESPTTAPDLTLPPARDEIDELLVVARALARGSAPLRVAKRRGGARVAAAAIGELRTGGAGPRTASGPAKPGSAAEVAARAATEPGGAPFEVGDGHLHDHRGQYGGDGQQARDGNETVPAGRD